MWLYMQKSGKNREDLVLMADDHNGILLKNDQNPAYSCHIICTLYDLEVNVLRTLMEDHRIH